MAGLGNRFGSALAQKNPEDPRSPLKAVTDSLLVLLHNKVLVGTLVSIIGTLIGRHLDPAHTDTIAQLIVALSWVIALILSLLGDRK